MDIESALFRIIDETLTGFISCHPDRVSIRLEWAADRTEARISARREDVEEVDVPAVEEPAMPDKKGRQPERELPAALKAMIDETRAAKVVRAARANQPLALPPTTWREVQQRADTIGATAELNDQDREVVLILPAS
jgi:hypothetical protein